MDTKPWYLSRTIWVNVLAGAAAVATAFGVDLGLDDQTKATIVAGVVAIVNIVLRVMTKQPVSLS